MTRQEISDVTGFDIGGQFQNEDEVRYYFRREQLQSCLNDPYVKDAIPDQAALDAMAEEVIRNRWHCNFCDDPMYEESLSDGSSDDCE